MLEEVSFFTKGTENRYSDNFNHLSFKNCLRELENTFTEICVNTSPNREITYQNPSIQDFIVNYIDQDKVLKLDLIRNSTYLNLLLEIFSESKNFSQRNKLSLLDGVKLEDIIIKRFDEFAYYERFVRSQKSEEDIIVLKLYTITTSLDLPQRPKLQKFVISKLNEILYSSNIKDSIYYFIRLLNKHGSDVSIDVKRIMKHAINEISEYDDILELSRLKDIDEESYCDFIEEEHDYYVEKISEIVSEIIQGTDDDELSSTLEAVEEIESISEIDFEDEKQILKQKIEELESPDYDDFDGWDRNYNSGNNNLNSEDRIIEDLFKSYQ